MTRLGRYAGFLTAVLLALFFASPANAQASRTWVSGVGDDANPCSRTAPCKTFAGAISKTAASGEINCLDPGGFGAVTITKSIAIVCAFTEGGITNPSTNAVNINGAGVVVFLNGLDIEGVGSGLNGINFSNGAALHIEHCIIRGANTASSTAGYGINFVPSAAAALYVSDTVIADNGAGSGATATGGAIEIKPTGTGSATISIDRVRMENNTDGITADATNSTGTGVLMTMTDSISSGGYVGVSVSGTTTSSPVTAQLNRVMVVNNAGYGIIAAQSKASLWIGDSVISGNGTSVLNAGATLASYGNNQIDGNTTNTLPTTTSLH